MSSESLISDPEKIPTAEDATPRTSEQVAASPSIVPESHEEIPHSSEGPAKPILLGDDGDSSESIDGATLNEIRSSIHTISNGVEELATTVQDLLGLSDSDSSGYEYDTQGQALFSWAKFRSRAKRRRHSRRQRKALGIGQLNGAKHDTESDGEISKKPRKTIPEIRECNFKQFQYRPAGDKLYCVDVLIAGDSLDDDIQAFEKTFDKMKSGMIEYVSDWMTESASEDGDEKWIRRIRINSRVVLETLQCVCPETKGFRSRPVVLHRPFQLLVSLHEEIKQQLNNLKGRPSDDLDEKEEGLEKPLNLSVVRDHDSGDFFQKLGEDEDALNELTCFMDFMESRIMPGARRYRDQSSPLPDTIRYEDLWYLFKPGDLVYVTRDTSGRDRFRATSSSHQVVRIIQTCLTSTSSIIPPMGMIYEPSWSFITHFIEHDGTCYSPRNFIFPPIPPFRGKMKVTDLVLYPVSYLQNDEIIAQAQSNGSSYVSLVERRSGYYSGWTRTIDPGGNRIMNNSSENRGSSPEHIESDILVDFEETFNAFPEWKPKFYFGLAADWKVRMDLHVPEQSELPVLGWDEEGRIRFEHFEQVLTRDMTEVNEGKRFLLEDPLGQFRKDMRKTPTGKFLSLVPSRFFAYAVLHRKFVQLDTRFVRSADLEANNQAFDKLEINRNYKRLILALVKSHFDKVETEKKTNVEIETQDLIRGKGKGVVILLHGVPGVGKTATAEAVALKWKKPLFPITCGDLGYSAEALEKSLNEIFRLAHHWGCILLLDEADVFITQRERQDLKRNALVSGKNRSLCFDLIL